MLTLDDIKIGKWYKVNCESTTVPKGTHVWVKNLRPDLAAVVAGVEAGRWRIFAPNELSLIKKKKVI